jgi:hypothetical protein
LKAETGDDEYRALIRRTSIRAITYNVATLSEMPIKCDLVHTGIHTYCVFDSKYIRLANQRFYRLGMEMLIESAIESICQDTKKNARMNKTKESLNEVVTGLFEGLIGTCHDQVRKLDREYCLEAETVQGQGWPHPDCRRRGGTVLFYEGLS